MNFLKIILIAGIRGYQRVISPALSSLLGPLGFGCRFNPTCSQYAIEAPAIRADDQTQVDHQGLLTKPLEQTDTQGR